jgi:hypothetical protein
MITLTVAVWLPADRLTEGIIGDVTVEHIRLLA